VRGRLLQGPAAAARFLPLKNAAPTAVAGEGECNRHLAALDTLDVSHWWYYTEDTDPPRIVVRSETTGDLVPYRLRVRAGEADLFADGLLSTAPWIVWSFAWTRDPRTDPERVAAIGYCFGGTGVLELARSGADIQGVVSFHGGLDSTNPEDGKNIKCKVLICHGAADPFVPAEGIAAMKQEFNAAGVDWQMVSYSGVVHSFTQPMAGNDPSKGFAYDELADKRSWAHMRVFFSEVLGPAKN